MVEITVVRRWLATGEGYAQQQRWSFAADVYCPRCGQLQVWVEETSRYEEDNVGNCHLCAACGHSFHYGNAGANYISEAETTQILAAVRSL